VRFQLKQYDSEAVIFDSASGDTHYLAPLALTLFQLCREFPGLPRNDLRSILAQRHEFEPGLPLDARVDETLECLRKVGLIRLE